MEECLLIGRNEEGNLYEVLSVENGKVINQSNFTENISDIIISVEQSWCKYYLDRKFKTYLILKDNKYALSLSEFDRIKNTSDLEKLKITLN